MDFIQCIVAADVFLKDKNLFSLGEGSIMNTAGALEQARSILQFCSQFEHCFCVYFQLRGNRGGRGGTAGAETLVPLRPALGVIQRFMTNLSVRSGSELVSMYTIQCSASYSTFRSSSRLVKTPQHKGSLPPDISDPRRADKCSRFFGVDINRKGCFTDNHVLNFTRALFVELDDLTLRC